jgi:hypothetical protein
MVKNGVRKKGPVLRRYTDLAAAMNILQTRTLTLTDPSRWDDGNDRYGMAEFKRRQGLQTLLAMCFATCAETYHHWRVFTEGKSGVCFEIDKAQLLAQLDTLDGFQHRGGGLPQDRRSERKPALGSCRSPFHKTRALRT